jgi:hypothetical protein
MGILKITQKGTRCIYKYNKEKLDINEKYTTQYNIFFKLELSKRWASIGEYRILQIIQVAMVKEYNLTGTEHVLCDCEAIAHLRFRHLGQFFMEPIDFYNTPISRVLHFI